MSLDRPEEQTFDGSALTVGIVAARFNPRMVDGLLDNCLRALIEGNVDQERIQVVRVPGSNEVPYALSMLAHTGQFDVLVGLGLVLAGETPHHEVIVNSTGWAMQRIGLETEVPVINGIVVVNTPEQAEARAIGTLNRGREFGLAALEMGLISQQLVDQLNDAADALGDLEEPWDGLSDKGDPWKL